jgi:carboxylesterase type B
MLRVYLDGKYLVNRATQLGKPFVLVSLNFRLGYLGFLSSKELQEDATRNNEGYIMNQGLNDQRIGLKWVGLPSPLFTPPGLHNIDRF